MKENQVADLATQKQLMKYADDIAKLYHQLKKERELQSRVDRKEPKVQIHPQAAPGSAISS